MAFYSHSKDSFFTSTGGSIHPCLNPAGVDHIIEIQDDLSRIITEFGETTEWKYLETYLNYAKSSWVEIPYPDSFAEPED